MFEFELENFDLEFTPDLPSFSLENDLKVDEFPSFEVSNCKNEPQENSHHAESSFQSEDDAVLDLFDDEWLDQIGDITNFSQYDGILEVGDDKISSDINETATPITASSFEMNNILISKVDELINSWESNKKMNKNVKVEEIEASASSSNISMDSSFLHENVSDVINETSNEIIYVDPEDIKSCENKIPITILPDVIVDDVGNEHVIVVLPPQSPASSDVSYTVPSISQLSPTSNVSFGSGDDSSDSDISLMQVCNGEINNDGNLVTKNRKPYTKNPNRKRKCTSINEKKQRKKDQNKYAAIRYRMKKKQQEDEVNMELNSLNKRNGELKSKVIDLERELIFLKKLIKESLQAKGIDV